MTIDKSLVKLHFDRHAHDYDRYADIQPEMAARLAAQVREHASRRAGPVRRILEIGCGTGGLTSMLASAFPEASIIAMDISARMIETARRKPQLSALESRGRLSFVEGDAETIAAQWSGRSVPRGEQAGFDLIVSNAAFQWLQSPFATARAYARMLAEGGMLAFSTFGPGTFRQLRESFAEAERRLGLPPVPHGQSFAGRSEWEACFAVMDGDFQWESAIRTLVYPDVRSFLRRIQRIGAGNATAGGSRGVGGRLRIETMERIYAETYPAPGGRGVEVDYDIGCGTFVRHKRDDTIG